MKPIHSPLWTRRWSCPGGTTEPWLLQALRWIATGLLGVALHWDAVVAWIVDVHRATFALGSPARPKVEPTDRCAPAGRELHSANRRGEAAGPQMCAQPAPGCGGAVGPQMCAQGLGCSRAVASADVRGAGR